MDSSTRTIEAIKALHPSIGAPQPKGDANWHPLAQSWWKSLGMSRVAEVYQPIDWMNAYINCVVLDQMCNFGFAPGLYTAWKSCADGLHAPVFDMMPQPDAIAQQVNADEDEEEADAGLDSLKAELHVVSD